MKNQLRNLICYPFYNSFYISFCGSCVAILLLFIPILFLSGCSAQKDYVLSDDDNKYAFEPVIYKSIFLFILYLLWLSTIPPCTI